MTAQPIISNKRNKAHEMLCLVDQVVSGGSVDGVLTTAAVLRTARNDCRIEFCQAFTVDRIDPSSWLPNRNLMLVGVAVNNRDEAMTIEFLKRLNDGGHKLVGIVDEHRAEDWARALRRAGRSFRRMLVRPVTGRAIGLRSAGAYLLALLESEELDSHTRALCEAADAADRMNFDTPLGSIVNSAVKSALHDNSRRVYLAHHLAKHLEPDETIRGWTAEYADIRRHHNEILAGRIDLGDGLVRITTFGRTVDMTSLLASLYKLGCQIAVIDGELYHQGEGRKTRQLAFGCAPPIHLNLVLALKKAGIAVTGYRRKATVAIDDEERAIAVVRSLLLTYVASAEAAFRPRLGFSTSHRPIPG